MANYLPSYYPVCESQGSYVNGVWKEPGSCVAHAIAYLKEVQEYKYRNISGYRFDYVWIYGNRDTHHWQGEGMYGIEALNMLTSDGVPRLVETRAYKNTYTSDQDPANYDPNHLTAKEYVDTYYNSLITEARTRRSSTSYTLYYPPVSATTIQSAIQNYGAALIEFWLTDDTYNARYNNGLITDIYDTPHETTHMMCVIGWKSIGGTNYWICQNSWGYWNGDSGTDANGRYYEGVFYMPFDYSKTIRWYVVPEVTPPSSIYVSSNATITFDTCRNEYILDCDAESELYYYAWDIYNPFSGRWYGANASYGTWSTIKRWRVGKDSVDYEGYKYSQFQNIQARVRIDPIGDGVFWENNGQQWAYTPVYTNIFYATRPQNFLWTTQPNPSGSAVNITAIDWNNLTTRINDFRRYKGLSQVSFSIVKGLSNGYTKEQSTPISATIFNPARIAVNNMMTTGRNGVNTGNLMYPSYFIDLVNDLNNIP